MAKAKKTAKSVKKDVIKAHFDCDNCKFWDNVCTHDSNKQIFIQRKVERLTFKNTGKKVKCENYVQSEIKL